MEPLERGQLIPMMDGDANCVGHMDSDQIDIPVEQGVFMRNPYGNPLFYRSLFEAKTAAFVPSCCDPDYRIWQLLPSPEAGWIFIDVSNVEVEF